MHVAPRLNKPLLIVSKLIAYTALFMVIRMGTEWLSGADRPLLSFLLTMTLVVVRRGMLTDLLQKFIDRSFYATLYRLKLSAEELDTSLNNLIDLDPLIGEVVHFLDRNFSSRGYQLVLNRDRQFRPLNGSLESGNAEAFTAINGVLRTLPPSRKAAGFLRTDQAWPEYEPLRDPLSHFMNANGYRYFFPLVTHKNLVGFLLFTEDMKSYLGIPEVHDFLAELFSKTAAVLDNAQVHTDIKRKSLESQLLLETVGHISATLNLQRVLESIIENLSRLVSYDAAAIFLVDEHEGLLQHSVSAGYREEPLDRLNLKLNEGISGQVIRTGKGHITPDVSRDPHYYSARASTKSQITVPIISRDRAIGAMALESDALNHFGQGDLELLTIFSGLAAIAIRNARLYEDSLKKQRLESDLVVASKVQKALLPRRVPTVAGLSIEVLSIPSLYVGGDLYDVFLIDDHRQGIAIGDGSGKGSPGAILMAVAYAGFKSLFKEIDPVNTIVARLNNLLAEVTTPGYYVTFFFGILDRTRLTFTFCNAGHTPTILMRPDGSYDFLLDGGTVAGFLPDQPYVQKTVPVQPGDILCFYTDGVTEIQRPSGEEFGEERLIAALRKSMGDSPKEIKFAVLREMEQFAPQQDFQDDVTMLIVRVE